MLLLDGTDAAPGAKVVRREAYAPSAFLIETVDLSFDLEPAKTRVLIRQSQCVPELIQPEEIAEVVLFLGSHASRVLTGQEVLADRGWAHS